MFDTESDEFSSRVIMAKKRQKSHIKMLEFEGIYRRLDELSGMNGDLFEYNPDNSLEMYLDYLITLSFNTYPFNEILKYQTIKQRDLKFQELRHKLEDFGVTFV